MSFDIYDFIFYDVLKYSTSSSVLTRELQHDVIFGLLVPSIFILIVIQFFVYGSFGAGSKMLGYLSSITAFGVIITLGWVPMIAGLGNTVFVLALIAYFARAIYRRLIPKSADALVYAGGKWAGKKIKSSYLDRQIAPMTDKDKRNLGKDLRLAQIKYVGAMEEMDTLKNEGAHVWSESDKALRSHRAKEDISLSLESAYEIVNKFPLDDRAKFIGDSIGSKVHPGKHEEKFCDEIMVFAGCPLPEKK